MKAAERAALRDVLDQIEHLRAYGVVRTGLAFELLDLAGGLPIPLGWIDDEGRLSIDAIAAHVPTACAQAYARDLAGLLGAKTTGPHQVMIIDPEGDRPLANRLLAERFADWVALIQKHAAQIHLALKVGAPLN